MRVVYAGINLDSPFVTNSFTQVPARCFEALHAGRSAVHPSGKPLFGALIRALPVLISESPRSRHPRQTLRDSMWYPFVRRLQRWWIKTQGNILDHKVTRAFNALAALDSRSTTSGVRRLPIVAGAIEPARDAYAKAATQVSREAISELTKLIDKATEVVDRGGSRTSWGTLLQRRPSYMCAHEP